MNEHLMVLCTVPTTLFIFGCFLLVAGIRVPDKEIRNFGGILILGAIVIVLKALHSLYGW